MNYFDQFNPFNPPFMGPYNPIVAVELIWRNKLHGPGAHFGVACKDDFGNVLEVIDVSDDRGLRFCSLDVFADGRRHHVVEEITDVGLLDQALGRIEDLRIGAKQWQFDIRESNCEHLARWITKGELESGQVQALGIVAVVGLFALLRK